MADGKRCTICGHQEAYHAMAKECFYVSSLVNDNDVFRLPKMSKEELIAFVSKSEEVSRQVEEYPESLDTLRCPGFTTDKRKARKTFVEYSRG